MLTMKWRTDKHSKTEPAGEPPLPRRVANSKVTGAVRNGVALYLVVSFLLAAAAAQASADGKITGTVVDQSNTVIPGATVVVLDTATGVKRTTQTDAQGTYSFPVLPVGQYEIDVTAVSDSDEQRGRRVWQLQRRTQR